MRTDEYLATSFALAGLASGGMRTAPPGVAVIGKTPDLDKPGAIGPGERRLNRPWKRNAKADWRENSGQLRQAIGEGYPIRDASPSKGGGFLRSERNLLENRGWLFNRGTSYWYPPGW